MRATIALALARPGQPADQPGGGLAVALLIVAFAVLTAPWLIGDLTIPYDAKAHFQTQVQFLATALHNGQSPFWAPHVFAGTPQIADPQSLIFSPALLLAWLFPQPSFRLVDGYVFAMLLIGALAIFQLARDKGWHPAGALTAALVFGFGSSAAWRVQHIGQIVSLAMLALALCLLERALLRPTLLRGALAGTAAGLMLIEPDQVALLGSYVLAGLVLARLSESDRLLTALKASLPALTTAAATTILIVALPLTMTWLFATASNRPAIAFAEAVQGSLHPASLLTGVVADLFGAHDPAVDYWGPYSEHWDARELFLSQNMTVIYLGALPALLITTLGIARGLLWRREVRFYAIAGLLMVLYAIGRSTPLFGLAFDWLPGVEAFRRPADATFLIGALGAILSGYLVHAWASGMVPAATRMSRVVGTGLLAVLLAAAVGVALACGQLGHAWRPIVAATLWLAAGAGLLALLTRFGARPGVVVAAITGFLVADLGRNNGPNESTALPRAHYDFLTLDTRNETVAVLKDKLDWQQGSPWRDRVELAGLGFDWPNVSLVHGFDHVLGYNPLRLKPINDAVGARDTIAGPDQRVFTPLFPSYRSHLANMMGLRFIASPVPIEQVDAGLATGSLPLVAITREAYVYENAAALPRAVFVTNWQQADFDDLTRTGQWPQAFDPARTVLLERGPRPIPLLIASLDAGFAVAPPEPSTHPIDVEGLIPNGAGSVNLPVYENTRVEIEVEAEQAGFLVLFDAWHPWWRATVDGRPAEIHKADVLFRAVRVPAGTHRVVMSFAPVAGAIAETASRIRASSAASRSAP